MPDAIKTLDALCVPIMVADSPIVFAFGGTDYIGTAGPRDTMAELAEGGFHADQDFALLVEIAQFGDSTRPEEKDIIELAVDVDGIPCSASDEVSRVNARVQSVGRAGAGLTYILRSATRG